MKTLNILFALLLAVIATAGQPDTEQKLKHYDFEDLLIKVKIQEPDVLFILDKPDIQAEPLEEEMNFLDKIERPVLKDNIF